MSVTDLNNVVVVGQLQLMHDRMVVAVVGGGLEGVLLRDVGASVFGRFHRGSEVGSAIQKSSSAAVKLREVF
jgi:hypothetical protein